MKPFKCSLCEYATRSKSNLKAHMNRHSTEKTHLCDMCGKKFKSKGTLKSHKLLHTADGEWGTPDGGLFPSKVRLKLTVAGPRAGESRGSWNFHSEGEQGDPPAARRPLLRTAAVLTSPVLANTHCVCVCVCVCARARTRM